MKRGNGKSGTGNAMLKRGNGKSGTENAMLKQRVSIGGREEKGWKVREHVAILAVGDRAGIAAGWRAVWPRIGMRGVLADKVPITQPFDEHSP